MICLSAQNQAPSAERGAVRCELKRQLAAAHDLQG
jgi:hypothetical protein